MCHRLPSRDDYDLKCTNGHDLCYQGTDPDCPYCERVYDLPNNKYIADRIEQDEEDE
jgi:hypothetical protein